MNLFIRLTVNGEVKQNGNTPQFIFTPEEQIEYASDILSLQSGDVFGCGTYGGVLQGIAGPEHVQENKLAFNARRDERRYEIISA
jgi:2-keto-4-pentenoate hydratase/2-oxohepta-3-ene-1,7-dioic acid hydratase in catechol pathway